MRRRLCALLAVPCLALAGLAGLWAWSGSYVGALAASAPYVDYLSTREVASLEFIRASLAGRRALGNDTRLVFGTSELYPGGKGPAHPVALLRGRSHGIDVMPVGRAYCESLWQAVELGALAPDVLATGDDRVVVPPILERHGSPYTIDDYERLRDHCYRTYSEADLELEPGARELIEGLRERGVAVGLVSTTIARCVLTALNRLRATDLFDVMVFGDMVTRCKPDPEPYWRALEFLGVDAAHAVVFEDSSTGVAAGQAAGCYTFGCTRCAIGQDLSCADELIDTFIGLRL